MYDSNDCYRENRKMHEGTSAVVKKGTDQADGTRPLGGSLFFCGKRSIRNKLDLAVHNHYVGFIGFIIVE